MTVTAVAPFSLEGMQRPPEGMNFFILDALRALDEGEVSDIVSYGDAAAVIHVTSKEVPEVEAVEIEELLARVRPQAATFTAQGILAELISARLGQGDGS